MRRMETIKNTTRLGFSPPEAETALFIGASMGAVVSSSTAMSSPFYIKLNDVSQVQHFSPAPLPEFFAQHH